MSIKQIEVAEKILDAIFLIDAHAIVAGGAPRDWLLGKEAADIDVFLYATGTTYFLEQKFIKAGFDITRTNEGNGLPEHYKLNPQLRAVFDCVYKGQNVQFLLMNEPTFYSVINHFPLSICKAWYKNGKIHMHKDFKRSVAHKVIVKTNTIYADENKYLQKVLAKFPDFKYYKSWESVAKTLLDGDV